MRKPCNNCPWRKDAPRRHWHPDHFTSIWVNCQDDGVNIMNCHKAAESAPAIARKLVCQGWVRVMKLDAIGVRFALMRDLVTIEEMNDADVPDLFQTFREMLVANGVKPPRRNRRTPSRRPLR